MRIAIISDIHYAGPAEKQRVGYPLRHLGRLQRISVALYRHYFWQRDPFAHNYLLHDFIARCGNSDLVVANGDYSCDSGAIGVSDDAACESARECLSILGAAFPERFEATFGDHEIGKKTMGGNKGGLKLASFFRAQRELGLRPFWRREIGNVVLIGVTSSLIAFPVYSSEAEAVERPQWEQLRAEHISEIASAFDKLKSGQRVLLFCHDPSALPFLFQEQRIRARVNQIERTIIGHLHSRLILLKSRILAGMPAIKCLGHTTHRLSTALRDARLWKPFKVLLCPSLAGIELLKDGGFCTCEIDLSGTAPPQFELHRLPHRKSNIDQEIRPFQN